MNIEVSPDTDPVFLNIDELRKNLFQNNTKDKESFFKITKNFVNECKLRKQEEIANDKESYIGKFKNNVQIIKLCDVNISWNASVLFAILIEMEKNIGFNLKYLHKEDQHIIIDLISHYGCSNIIELDVTYSQNSFEKNKYFILTIYYKIDSEISAISFEFLNPISNSKFYEELDNEKIPLKKGSNNILKEKKKYVPKSGKSAYEIRADILSMAIDCTKNRAAVLNEENVLGMANKFYDFVENKNRN